MVAAVRGGLSQRATARRFKLPLSTIQFWLKRAGSLPLEQVDWSDRDSAPRLQPRQTCARVEQRVVRIRGKLASGDLGFVGAEAIREQLLGEWPARRVPSERTIGRILKRQGLLDGRHRVRRAPPPPGWYLPEVAARRAELDAFDVIEDLSIEGGPLVSVLCGRSLYAGHRCAWPAPSVRVEFILEKQAEFWRKTGLPAYVQFDNDTRFQGSHCSADVFGRVIRWCLSLGVTPVFAPPAEHGPQNVIESFNQLWLQKVWHRFDHPGLPALCRRSDRFLAALQTRLAQRLDPDALPTRRPFPRDARVHDIAWNQPLQGRVIFMRRANEKGGVSFLGHSWTVDAAWQHRLLRAEIDFVQRYITFVGLRRAQHNDQPILLQVPYAPPDRLFSPG